MKKIIRSIFLLSFVLAHYAMSQTQKIAVGHSHMLTLCNDSTVWAWGRNDLGQLGNNTFVNSNIPVQVTSLTSVTDIASGSYHSFALKQTTSGGELWVWGYNNWGQLGDSSFVDSDNPLQPLGILSGVTFASGGGRHSDIILNNAPWAVGSNSFGVLGDGTNIPRLTYVPILGITDIITIDGGNYHTIGLKSDSTVWAWGRNDLGQLGNGNNIDSYTPVQVNGLSGVVAISCFHDRSLVLKSDGTVWNWGSNQYFQLGDSTIGDSNIPIQVPTLTNIIAISAGIEHSLALKSDSTVWAWGWNIRGQLGDGTTDTRCTPVQVTGLTGVVSIGAGSLFSAALKSDGTVWAWGWNNDGQLGTGDNIESHVPVQTLLYCAPITGDISVIDKSGSHLYPNPATSELVVSGLEFVGKREIEIYNVLGEKVYSQQETSNQQPVTINVSQLPSGIYFVKVKTEKEERVGKFVKE